MQNISLKRNVSSQGNWGHMSTLLHSSIKISVNGTNFKEMETNKIGLLLCHSHTELRLWLRLILRLRLK